MKTRIQRFREFTQYDLWRQPHMSMLSPQKRVLYRILQTIILVVRGFKDKVLNFRANSLSFALLFAFVPMLALMYAVARGFGFEQLVLEQLSGSFLAEANIAPTLIEWIERYLETARGGLFLGFGLIVLVWAVYAFFNMLEKSFNSIWNVSQSRSLGRRLTNYIIRCIIYFGGLFNIVSVNISRKRLGLVVQIIYSLFFLIKVKSISLTPIFLEAYKINRCFGYHIHIVICRGVSYSHVCGICRNNIGVYYETVIKGSLYG